MSYDKAMVEQITELVIQSLKQYSVVETKVPVGVSARHIHLERQHLEQLFGKDCQLKQLKPLSQPGQFASEETVDLIGPKGTIEKVRILGPERSATQVEVTMTDARKLGMKPPVRTSIFPHHSLKFVFVISS